MIGLIARACVTPLQVAAWSRSSDTIQVEETARCSCWPDPTQVTPYT
jgi:hypothetical protein